MSAFVLNRGYELQLPNSYVDIDNDEMEYVDGGAYATSHWWEYAINLNESECEDLIYYLRTGKNVFYALGLMSVKLPPFALALGLVGVYTQQMIDSLTYGKNNGGGATLNLIKQGSSGYFPTVNPW